MSARVVSPSDSAESVRARLAGKAPGSRYPYAIGMLEALREVYTPAAFGVATGHVLDALKSLEESD